MTLLAPAVLPAILAFALVSPARASAKLAKKFASPEKCLLILPELRRLLDKTRDITILNSVADLPATPSLFKKYATKLNLKAYRLLQVALGTLNDSEQYTLVLAVGGDGKVRAMVSVYEIDGD